MNEVTGLLGAMATLTVGVTGLLKILRLWRAARRSARTDELEAETASLRRLLDDCGTALEAYERDRWNWEQG